MNTHQLTLKFSDSERISLTTSNDQSVLASALQAGTNLLHQCKAGSCGSCVGKVVSGVVRMRKDTSIALLPKEIEEGYVLTCLAHAESDAEIHFNYNSQMLVRDAARLFRSWVNKITPISSNVMELSLEVDESKWEATFVPGMYYMLRVPGTDLWRPYSMASTVRELPMMKFLIRIQPDGAMSNYLHAKCHVDDELELEGPFGTFQLHRPEGPLLLMAGGTGLAPVLSILDTLIEERWHKYPIILCFGVSRFEELFYLDELDARTHWLPNLEVRVSLAQQHSQWTGVCGYVTDLIKPQDLTSGLHAYLCGPPPMVGAAVALLQKHGLPLDNIYFESFTTSMEVECHA